MQGLAQPTATAASNAQGAPPANAASTSSMMDTKHAPTTIVSVSSANDTTELFKQLKTKTKYNFTDAVQLSAQLGFFSPVGLVSNQLVSKRWKAIATENAAWKPFIIDSTAVTLGGLQLSYYKIFSLSPEFRKPQYVVQADYVRLTAQPLYGKLKGIFKNVEENRPLLEGLSELCKNKFLLEIIRKIPIIESYLERLFGAIRRINGDKVIVGDRIIFKAITNLSFLLSGRNDLITIACEQPELFKQNFARLCCNSICWEELCWDTDLVKRFFNHPTSRLGIKLLHFRKDDASWLFHFYVEVLKQFTNDIDDDLLIRACEPHYKNLPQALDDEALRSAVSAAVETLTLASPVQASTTQCCLM